MITKREILAFFLGAQLFHTISHILILGSGTLPITIFSIVWTQQLNMFAVGINAVITLLLAWWFISTRK